MTDDFQTTRDYPTITRYLYFLIERYFPRRFDHTVARKELPTDGIYLFFEKGETIGIDKKSYDRIVRVGTHNVDGRFPGRIRQHYGSARNLHGNKNGSVFRKHLGGAILHRDTPEDPRLPEWLKQMGRSDPATEILVSRMLRDNFTFICFPVSRQQDRLALESGLISLLARYPLGKPSETWIGMYADSPVIRETGLWNTKETDKAPLTFKQLETIGLLMAGFSRGEIGK